MKTIIALFIITILILSNNTFAQSCEDIQQQIDSYNQKIENTNNSITTQKREIQKYTSMLVAIKKDIEVEKELYEKVKNNQRLVRWPGWPDEITKTFGTEAGDISISVNGSDTVSITAPETIKEINIYFKKWERDDVVSDIEEGTLMQNISNINTKSCKFVLSKDIPKNWYDAYGKIDFIVYNTMDIVLNNNKIIETTFNIQVDKEKPWGQGY